MPRENTTLDTGILSEPIYDASGYCSICHGLTHFITDKEHGYYKECPHCGNTEHLSRRTLKFDRYSRQWL